MKLEAKITEKWRLITGRDPAKGCAAAALLRGYPLVQRAQTGK
jgi:hypothetical protein